MYLNTINIVYSDNDFYEHDKRVYFNAIGVTINLNNCMIECLDWSHHQYRSKTDVFWDRTHYYCKESNLRTGNKWSNSMLWIMLWASWTNSGECSKLGQHNWVSSWHLSIKLKYKKFNFDKHWSEFRRQPKWRTLSTNICSTKRNKLNNCWTYPSSMNETPLYDNVVESSICP